MSKPFITMDVGGVQSAIEGMGRKLDAAVDQIALATQLAMGEIANDVISEAQSRIVTRSGDLSRSAVVEEVEVSGEEMTQRFGFNKKYARQRDQGGTIQSKSGKMLAIPLDPVLTGRGVARYSSPLEDTGAPNGMFVVRLWGKVFLAQHIGKGKTARLQLRWLLINRVEQTGSRFFSAPVQEAIPDIPRRIAERVANILGDPA